MTITSNAMPRARRPKRPLQRLVQTLWGIYYAFKAP